MAATKKPEPKQQKKTAPVPAKKAVKNKPSPAARKAAAKPAQKSKSAKPSLKKPAPVKKKEVLKKGATAPKTKMTKEIKKDTHHKDRMTDLKAALLKKKEAIVREAKEEIAKYISGENRQLVDTAVDEGDWATVDISEDINLMRLDAHRKLLRDIDESLRKIREGSYGICEECGEEISEKRLHVMPTATLCIACKENREQLEAVAREEAD